ncbi:hypothetical protein [Chengkuizengella axinellae]|uniref:Phage protein n=1 Tax=Chengkuizengella axinellae TaxID=3064388 RepID=A0ABT9J6M6_9BACL|nr:hypothetical protein [Chengkuizengella sp. 2205SS18-9]MDP5277203.1 hypothetical protein [Chengkuizengella sp. 2205SS18-9]
MNLENSIKDVIAKKLEDGTVDKLVAEHLEKGVNNALDSLFRSYGDVTKVIEEKVKSVMIPYLESYDYSEYITKLDSVLVDVLNCSALENKKLLENFKELMLPEDIKTIKVTELFKRWMKYVAKNIETDDLEICYEDGPSYEYVEVGFEVERNEERSWSSFEHAIVVFECEKDEKMNFEIRIDRWKKYDKEEWSIDYSSNYDINSLRRLGEFEILLMKLEQNHTKLILDSLGDSDDVEPEEKPEVSFS